MDTEDDDTMSQEEWHKEMQTEIAAYPCKARDLDAKLDELFYQIGLYSHGGGAVDKKLRAVRKEIDETMDRRWSLRQKIAGYKVEIGEAARQQAILALSGNADNDS